VRDSVGAALADGSRGVTAKIRWLSHAVHNLESSYEEGRPRWIHCTPLLGSSGAVGVWMVVLVDEEKHAHPVRRFRQAPPVAHDVRSRKEGGRQTMLDDYDDFDGESYAPTTASLVNGQSYGSGTARHAVVDTLRGSSSPRSSGQMHEQRALRSASSSIRDYAIGGNGSTDTFHI